MLDHVLPIATVKHLIQQYQQTGQREKRRVMTQWAGQTDQAEVADALRRIPPMGIEYDEWLAVLMALHREYGDAALPLAEAWADGKPGEVERKFRSFKPAGNTTGAVGLGSVFLLAQRFGWSKERQ